MTLPILEHRIKNRNPFMESREESLMLPKKVLIFAPHPDDEVLGCGGSLLKKISTGCEVAVIYMTSGEGTAPASVREKEALASCQFLGVKTQFFLREPDGFLTLTPHVVEAVTAILDEESPHIVYVPHGKEKNRDHTATHTIAHHCLVQCKPEIVLAYEVWTPMQNYGLVEDITGEMEQKIEALKLHQSQLSQFPYLELAQTLARFRGIVTGVGNFCEVFLVEKMVW